MDKRIIPLIMCGGAGTRLWPASREVRPKQFLALFGTRSTFQDTLLRVSDATLFDRPIVITNAAYRFMVLEQLAEIGIEADINSVRVRQSSTVTRATAPSLSLGYTLSESVASNWLFTLRGGGGIAFGDALVYLTGGLALADNKFSQSSFFPNCPCGVTGETSGTKAGWVIGGGIEYAFAPQWTMKAEYLYVDLGHQSFADNLGAAGFPAASFTHDEHLTESIARIGVNYRFGGPVVARY